MQRTGRAIGDGGGDHARASATWLTGVAPKRTEGSDVEAGISADQVAAQELGRKTPLRSLELGLEQSSLSESGYRSIYANTISWRTPTSPNPTVTNPGQVFERLFGASGSTDQKAGRKLYSRRSILDLFGPTPRGCGPLWEPATGSYLTNTWKTYGARSAVLLK